MGVSELLFIGIGIIATVILGGGGAWLMKVFKGQKSDPNKPS